MHTTQTPQCSHEPFETLFERSRRRVYRFAYHLTGNATDAEDVVQDAYVRAWQHFERYDTT
ncbi:MAG: polymerase sigma factor, sigma-70 family, partial [Chthonomonadales bacterium]|nr:polymerase sigma factor, sigma-70 family [Chthonomonadales bacterium]